MTALQELGSYETRPELTRKLGTNMFLARIYYQYNQIYNDLHSVGIHIENMPLSSVLYHLMKAGEGGS